jgi:hypothetical protein
MLSLAQMRKRLANKTISDADFLETHICVEGLLKRVLLIGLRVRGVQYRDARQFIKVYNPGGLKKTIPKTLKLLDITPGPKLRELTELVVEVTAKYRNLRVHGIRGPFNDTAFLKLLINIDREFMIELRRIVQQEKGADIFDKPAKFGAAKIPHKTEPKAILTGILEEQYRGIGTMKYTTEQAGKMFAGLKNK